MLGRYVTGTLLVLGAAMVLAPSAPDRGETEVTRAQSSAMSLATAPSQEPRVEPVSLEPAGLAAPTETAMPEPDRSRIDAALAGVLAEEAAEPEEAVAALGQIGGIAALAGLEPAPAEIAAVQAPRTVRPDYLYVTGSRVNVRSGPSTDYSVVSRVVYGDAVEVVSQEPNGWAEIRIVGSDTVGFMSGDFLSPNL